MAAQANALLYLETDRMTMSEAVQFMGRYAPYKEPEELGKELTQGQKTLSGGLICPFTAFPITQWQDLPVI